MADSDPPDEIDDRKTPGGWNPDSPDAHAFHHQKGDHEVQQHQEAEGDEETKHPARSRAARQHDGTDFVGYCLKRVARTYERFRPMRAFGSHSVSPALVDVSALLKGGLEPIPQNT